MKQQKKKKMFEDKIYLNPGPAESWYALSWQTV